MKLKEVTFLNLFYQNGENKILTIPELTKLTEEVRGSVHYLMRHPDSWAYPYVETVGTSTKPYRFRLNKKGLRVMKQINFKIKEGLHNVRETIVIKAN